MFEVNNYGLRACPCCGEFVSVVLRGDRFGNVCAYCTRCGLSTKFYEKTLGKKSAARKAADAWNMRRPPRYDDIRSNRSE